MSELSEKCQTSTSSGGSSKSLGVQKFCSKLRHKIEDNLNSSRLTNKLRKSSRHSMSMSALSGIADATTGKYTTKSGKLSKEVLTKTKTMQMQATTCNTNQQKQQASGMLKHKRVVTKSFAVEKNQDKPEGSSGSTGSDMTAHKQITNDSCIYVDSDDEYQLPSLSWTKQSLEDEIFEELEKAAHDENKLNSVLKSFDRILTDFHVEIDAKNLITTADNENLENHVNINAIEKVEKPHHIDKVSSNNFDEKFAPEIALEKNLEPEIVKKLPAQIVVMNKKEIPHKLSKSRTTLCENNLPKKLSPTSKLNKSVLDVATPTSMLPVASKIPIWKALPLSKRSKSFCNAAPTTTTSLDSTKQKPIIVNPINISMGNRAISYTTLPRHKLTQVQQQQNQRSTLKNNSNNKLIKSKTELNVKTKPQNRNSCKPTTTTTTTTLPQSLALPQKSGNLRSHTNSDELLDKCLEKGQKILRQIETLGEQGARLKAATQNAVKKTNKTVTKENANKRTKKIESYDETLEIKKKDPKYLADKGRQNSDALSDDSGHISNEADVNQTNGLCESSTSTLESFGDSTQLSTNTHPISTQQPSRSTKIIELLQKFENNAKNNAMTNYNTASSIVTNKKSISIKPIIPTSITTTTTTATETTNNLNKQFTQQICTSLKVSEVETVHRVQTHIEIFPNYSKEVTTWFY